MLSSKCCSAAVLETKLHLPACRQAQTAQGGGNVHAAANSASKAFLQVQRSCGNSKGLPLRRSLLRGSPVMSCLPLQQAMSCQAHPKGLSCLEQAAVGKSGQLKNKGEGKIPRDYSKLTASESARPGHREIMLTLQVG
jgi:hypothetical protein